MPAVQHPTLMSKAAAGDRKAFETALASLGRSTISSLSPAISRYEIGFQVLDQDDDNYCAVGVFGYKIGKRLMYVPMFYRDGVIKGVEQLRDPKRNLSVPLNDNWVNKFLADEGDEPPKLINKARTRDTASPSLWQLKYPPTKYGADQWAAAVAEIKPNLARAMIRSGGWPDSPDLLKVASEYPEVMTEVERLITGYPWFAKAVEKFYGLEKLSAAVKSATKAAAELQRETTKPEQVLRKTASVRRSGMQKKAARLTVIRVSTMSSYPLGDSTNGPLGLSPSEAAELKLGRNAYRDDRGAGDITAIESAWGGSPGGGSTLHNPEHSGIYLVLGEDMKLHECAVFFPLVSWNEEPDAAVVYRIKDGACAFPARAAVWAAAAPMIVQHTKDWYDKLPKAENIPTDVRVAAVFMDRGGHLVGSAPFTSAADGTVYCTGSYPSGEPYWIRPGYRLSTDPGRGCSDWTGKRVRVVASATRMTTQSNTLYLPPDARYIKLDGDRFRPAYGDDPERFLIPTIKGAADYSGTKPPDLLCVTKTKYGFVIDPGNKLSNLDWTRNKSAADAEADLVEYLGLLPEGAKFAIDTASKTGSCTMLVKYANSEYGPPYLENNYPNAPNVDDPGLVVPGSFADDVVPSTQGSSLAITVQDLMPEAGSQDRYRLYPTDYGLRVPLGGVGNSGPNQDQASDRHGPISDDDDYGSGDVKRMSSAASGGIKELFDTASLSAIVKRKGVSRVIDKVVRASVKTMNAAADALCHLYWNPDEWGERFGTAEVGPIEDQLTDQFKGVGDLYLTLLEKAVDGSRDFGILPGLDTVDAASSGGK